MNGKVQFFVEGKADKKFLEDMLLLYWGDNSFAEVKSAGGITELFKSPAAYKSNSHKGGINLVFADADTNFATQFETLIANKSDDLKFELFLFPDNKGNGNLETLLEQLINPKHESIFKCFKAYQDCLKASNQNYRVPALKTKIYSYVDTLVPLNQEELAKELNRNYLNTEHWHIENNPAIEPLRQFLVNTIQPWLDKQKQGDN